jgi:hypothetical protein
MLIATTVSLVGNIQVSLIGHTASPFAWLESIAPPLLVLSTAYVLKEQVLGAIEMRHANEQVFQTALADWQIATASPEDHSHWQQFYANALRDALRKTNNRRQETLSQMTQDDWQIVVFREMQAEQWYEQPEQDETLSVTQVPPKSAVTASKNGNSPKVAVAVVRGDV